MAEKSKYEAQIRYDKKNTTQLMLKLNLNTDSDIIEWLKSLDNKQGTIKRIIRDYLKENQLHK